VRRAGNRALIDQRAVVDPDAKLSQGVSIGAFCVIGSAVEIGAGTRIGPHVVIQGPTRIGRDNRIHPFASIGDAAQDKKYAGEPARLEIGDRNTIREYCTINRGTRLGGGVTRVGNDNWIMAYVHIAHDCEVGSHTVFANAASLAGHVRVDDYAVLGGFTLVSQFCRLGAYSFTAMGSVISRDIPPYVLVSGHMAQPYGVNVEGLRRNGFDDGRVRGIRQAYKLLYRSGLSLENALARLRDQALEQPDLQRLIEFLASSERGIVR
jgi:UDP-N-acetylglucosamine acyltransferase